MPAPRNAFLIFNMPEGEHRKGRRVGAYGRGEERGGRAEEDNEGTRAPGNICATETRLALGLSASTRP